MSLRSTHISIYGLLLGCMLATSLYASVVGGAVTSPSADVGSSAAATRFEFDASEALLSESLVRASAIKEIDTAVLARELDRMAASARALHQREERLLRRSDLRSGQSTQRLESAGLPGRVNASRALFASAILPDASPGRVLRNARYQLPGGLLRMSAGPARDADVVEDQRRGLHLYSLRNGAMGDESYTLLTRQLSASTAGSAIACVQPLASPLPPHSSPFSSLSLSTFSLSIHRPAIAPASVFAPRYHFAQASASASDFRYLTTVSVGFLSGEFA